MSYQTRERRRLRLLSLFCLVFSILSGTGEAADPPTDLPGSQPPDQLIESFLQRYWDRPLTAQGKPPSGFGELEASLAPGSCGTCHSAQFNDWRQSLHSRAMGPGVAGQLVDMSPQARDEHQACIRCHAPLKEQADSLAASLAATRESGVATTPRHNPGRPLHEEGLVCATCHVRGYQWYGPPRRPGLPVPTDPAALPHGGWQENTAFEDSRFCAACHQFEADGYALNGKLLENTLAEWQASRYARKGVTCQSCHMPDRRHLWRGIHDLEMTGRGVDIQAQEIHVTATILYGKLTMKNTGTGHYFPTYVTPRVLLEGYQTDARGKSLPGTLRQYTVGRKIALDLSKEYFDTRLAPDADVTVEYEVPLHGQATSLVFRVRVEPDAFYTRSYQALLDSSYNGRGRNQIEAALLNSQTSKFTIYESHHPVLGDKH
ncbi:MAG TPA: hypothetical protein ENI80_12350 [Acidiferrobacteraceae bacterium]|nr:hypothetical protein [Acidiferrobacteraceae bacterium]